MIVHHYNVVWCAWCSPLNLHVCVCMRTRVCVGGWVLEDNHVKVSNCHVFNLILY